MLDKRDALVLKFIINLKQKMSQPNWPRTKSGKAPKGVDWLECSQITLDWIRGWFKTNVERTKQVGGAKNSYVAPRAYHEFQCDIFYITDI